MNKHGYIAKMTVYECDLCGHQSIDLTGAFKHVEEHPELLSSGIQDKMEFITGKEIIIDEETLNLLSDAQELGIVEDAEKLNHRFEDSEAPFDSHPQNQEWSDINPTKEVHEQDVVRPEQKAKKYYEYPSPKGYASDARGTDFKCKCGFHGDFAQVYKHTAKEHPEDFKEFVRQSVRDSIIRQHQKVHPSEMLHEEQIAKWTQEGVDAVLANLSKEEKINLGIWSEPLDEQLKFFKGEREGCSFCGQTTISYKCPSEENRCIQNQILNECRRAHPQCRNYKFQDFEKLSFCGQWQGEKQCFDFLSLIHAATAHRERFQDLISQGILTGTVPEFLAAYVKSYTQVPEKLSAAFVDEVIKVIALTKGKQTTF